MSQSGNLSVTVPPGAALSVVTDSGSATAAANVINLVTTGAGADGIATSGAGNTVTITLTDSSVSGTTSTVGAVTGDVITFAAGATPGTYEVVARVCGFESTTPAGAGYLLTVAVRTTGAAATVIGVVDKVANEEAALSAADATIVASGNNFIVRVTGVAALNIDWKSTLNYTFVS